MSKVLSGMGAAFLALLVFVGLVHAFLLMQNKNSPETMESLHALPVIGGFFFPPSPEEPPLTPDERRELKARQGFLESREFFPLPEGFDRRQLEELFAAVKDARTRYEQGLNEVEQGRTELSRVRAEVAAEQESLAEAAKGLELTARDLQAGMEELRLRANRLEAEEVKNLKASAAIYAQMPPDLASKILAELDVDTVAKTLKQMTERKSAPILTAMDVPRAVEVTQRLIAITSETWKADTNRGK